MSRAQRLIEPLHPDSDAERQRLWTERLAIEIERLALEEAIARTIALGQAGVRQPYQAPRTILRHPYLPTFCTAALLFVLAYLGSK